MLFLLHILRLCFVILFYVIYVLHRWAKKLVQLSHANFKPFL